MTVHVMVLAKQPRPGHVKTRLCPPCTPEQAALVAAASLSDTLAVVSATPAVRRTLVIAGHHEPPAGWSTVDQRGGALGERLAHAFADTVRPGVASLLIGMDTPQVTPALLTEVAAGLADADAVLGPAYDGGWWALALREPAAAAVLAEVPMSRPDTGELTLAALRRYGLRVALAPPLRDVDTAADAHEVARLCPYGTFAPTVRACVPVEHEVLA